MYIIVNNVNNLIKLFKKIIEFIKNKIKPMTLANKTYRNNKTGETIKVLDNFGDVVILESKQKMDKNELLDTNQYTEQIDPNSFFDTSNAYTNVLDSIKKLPTDDMVDENVKFDRDDSFKPSTDESAIVQYDEESEKEALARKYGIENDVSSSVNKQKEAFDKILNPNQDNEQAVNESSTEQPKISNREPVDKQENFNRETTVAQQQTYREPPTQRVEVEDPIIAMFKRAKKIVDFKFDLVVDKKIPRIDFVEMMEDSYDVSMIEFLADEITQDLLNDPSVIKNIVKKEIENKVYGVKKDVKKTSSKKPSASERAKSITKLETIPEVKKALNSEKAKTVIKAGKERIEELNKKQ